MTMSKPSTRESLNYKLKGTIEELTSWGHEFVRSVTLLILTYFRPTLKHRNLASEIAEEHNARQAEEKPVDDLIRLVDQIIPFNIKHNAEPEACDLLIEIEALQKLLVDPDLIDDKNYSRVCSYLTSCSNYLPEPENTEILRVTMQIYRKMQQLPDALRLAIKLNEPAIIEEIYTGCEDESLFSFL